MTITEESPETTLEVGRSRLRKEDQRLITGRTRFTDNLTVPGMLFLGMVRSPIAHAKITSIDVAQAKASPGVIAVFTGSDLADDVGPMPCGWPLSPEDRSRSTTRSLSTRSTSQAKLWQWSWLGAPKLPATRRSWSMSSTKMSRLSSISRLPRPGLRTSIPDWETNVSTHWVFDSAEAGTGADVKD